MLFLKVIRLVSRSGGETDDVGTCATEPNQCTYAFKDIFSFDELLYYGRVRGSLRSIKYAYFKITFKNLKSFSFFHQGFKSLVSTITN